LRSRWRIVGGVFGCIVLLALAAALFLPKQYTATSSVVISTNTDPLAGQGYADQVQSSYVATQTEVIASERVAQRAVKAVKLDQDPAIQEAWRSKTGGEGDISVWLARQLIAGKVVDVAIAGETKVLQGNVINISVRWPDPKMAAALANAFAQAAIETNIELKIEPAKQYAKWFDEKSRALRADVELKQKRLSDFENANGIVATDEKLDVENARLAELSTQLVTIETLRQDSQSRQRQTGVDNQSLPEVMQSPVIAKLKSDLSDAEARQSDIASRLGKNHPDFQAAAVEVSNLKARIAQESDKIASSLGSNTQINVRRENDLRAALEAQKKRVLELKHQHDEASVLENDVTTAQRDLDAVSQRYAQSSLESQMQQTSMVLLTTAMILELRDPRVRGDAEVLQLSGVPILVRMGSIKVRDGDGKSGPPSPTRTPAPI
jgi:chain length determinant protein EpsF